jgi:hypothetical protein
LRSNSIGRATIMSAAIPAGNCGTPCEVERFVVVEQSAPLSWLFAAFTVMVVVLLVLGAVTFTEIVVLTEADVPEDGYKVGETLTMVQAEFDV